jgi:hypothetical protein
MRPSRLGAWQSRTVHDWARDALADETVPPLAEMIHYRGNRTFDAFDLGYPVAGSFVAFLLGAAPGDAERIVAFRAFFDDANVAPDAAGVAARFEEHLGLSLDEAERAWRAFLSSGNEP